MSSPRSGGSMRCPDKHSYFVVASGVVARRFVPGDPAADATAPGRTIRKGTLVRLLLDLDEAHAAVRTLGEGDGEEEEGVAWLCERSRLARVRCRLAGPLLAAPPHARLAVLQDTPACLQLCRLALGEVVNYFARRPRGEPELAMLKYKGHVPELGPGVYFGLELLVRGSASSSSESRVDLKKYNLSAGGCGCVFATIDQLGPYSRSNVSALVGAFDRASRLPAMPSDEKGAPRRGDDAGSFKTTLVLHLKEKEHMPRHPQKSEALIDLDPFMVTGTAAGAVNGHSPVQEAGHAPWTIDSFAQQQDGHTLARRDSLYNRRQEKHHGTLSPVSVVKTDNSAGKQKGLPSPGVVAADAKKKQQLSPKAADGCCNGAERVCRSEYVFSEEGDPAQDSRPDLLGDAWPGPPARGRAGRRLGSGSEPPVPATAAPDRPVCASPEARRLFSDSPEPLPAHDLGVGSLVEVVVNKEPRYGVIRWIGTVPEDRKCRKVAGIEMEEEYVGLTDGTFSGRRYFHCNPKRAMFVGLRQCQKDSRFQDAPHPAPDCSTNTFGQIDCPPIKGPVRPISRKGNLEAICGKNRGIQGHHNSCYLDATLFSMFTFTSVFDSLLFRPRGRDDSAHYDEVQRVLREEIVNPLRANLYVRADRVMKLRTLLENLSSVSGLTSEEKDPEEFLNSLVAQTLRAEPFLKLSSGQEAYHYQLFVEKDERVKFPTVQQLLEESFLVSGIKLKEVPSCLIIQMPRFGKSFKMYQRILPSQLLDVTDIIEDSPRQCVVCGKPADFECKECYGQCGVGLESTAFCVVCLQTVHGHQRRASHAWRPLKVPAEFRILQDHCAIPRLFMELFTVVCIETSHYVAFVKCGSGHDAPWCFFDSMADRKEGVPVGGQLHELQPVYGGALGGDTAGQPTFLQDMGVLADAAGQDPNYALLQKEVTESMYVLASDEHYGRSPSAAGCDQVDAHQSLEQSIALQIGQRAVDQVAPAATELQSVSSAGPYALQPGAGDEGAWQSATEVDVGGVTYIVPDGSGTKATAPVSRLSPGTVQWLLENYETAEGQSLPRYALYTHYLYHCQENGFEPVNAASFGKLIRAVFLGLRTRRLGTRGNSKYHYYGIRVKPGSKLNGIPLASPAGGKQRGAQRRPGSSPGPFCLGGGTYTPCRPVALPQTKIFGDASKAIPEFPPIELPPGYDLPQDDIEIFHYVYKEHLEAFLDALVNLELGTVESLLHEFWRSSCVSGDETEEEKYFPKSKLYVLCDCPYVQQLVESVDFHFYQNLLWLLVPDVLKPLSGGVMKSLQDLAASFETWLANSMRNCPAGLARAKMAAGGALARALRRHLALVRVAEAAGAMLRDPSRVTQMLVDTHHIDLSHVQHQACWVARCEEATVACLLEGLKGCLREGRQLEGLAAWLKDTVQQALQPYEGKPPYVGAARKFLLRWSYYSSLVMREVTLANASSFGSLFLLRLLLDGYLHHLVEHRVAEELRQIPLLVTAQKLAGGQDPAAEPDLRMFAE